MKMRTLAFILSLLIGISPSCAFALAGFAERTSVFNYNDYRQVIRGHPSDLCHGETKWCLVLRKPDNIYDSEENSHFEEISVPQDIRVPYILGRRSGDNDWIVYDLVNEEVLAENASYSIAINAWYALGFKEPQYVNGRNTRELLEETEESISTRWRIQLQLWFFLGVIPASIVTLPFWLAGRQSRRKYRKGGKKVYRILAYLFFIPVLAFFGVAFYSLFEIVRYNW